MVPFFLYHAQNSYRKQKKRMSFHSPSLHYLVILYKPKEAFTANTFSSAAAFTASYSSALAKGNFTSI